MEHVMTYALEQRMRFIDFLLSRYGHVGRNELIDFFAISEPQATRDFRAYKELAPDNTALNSVTKRYEKTDSFKRVFA